MNYILVTGGLGYIGSHTVVELLEQEYNVIIIDNLSNSKIEVETKIKQLVSGRDKVSGKLIVYIFDLHDKTKLQEVFKTHNIINVIHFAGYKSVNESISNPLKYYNNITMTINLLEVMRENNCKKIIFSSSATVYGSVVNCPIKEEHSIGNNLTSPYAESKYIIENILNNLYKSDKEWNIYILRYFNPVGCHHSGLIGEDPNDIPNNLFPYILKVANKTYKELQLYGDDYNTRDGTCIRDFIHVVDLARAHMKCLISSKDGMFIYNVGTGNNTSVKELIKCFEDVNNIIIQYKKANRRPGDIEMLYSDNTKIMNELGWKPEYNIEDMCKDGWNFIKNIH